MRSVRLRIGLGPLALGLALSLGRCGGPPLGYALAEESEPALVLVEDGISYDEPEQETEQEPEPQPETEQETEPKQEQEQEPEPGQETEPEPEPEPEPEQETEPEQEPETEPELEQTVTTDDVLEHIDDATERLDAVVDLLMIAAGGMGALMGAIAFGKLWGPLAGER